MKNPDSPFKSDAVQLVGFTSYAVRADGEAEACHSLDSADTVSQFSPSQCLDTHHRAASDSRTLSR